MVWVSPPNKEPVYNSSWVNLLQEDAMGVFFIGHRFRGMMTNYSTNMTHMLAGREICLIGRPGASLFSLRREN